MLHSAPTPESEPLVIAIIDDSPDDREILSRNLRLAIARKVVVRESDDAPVAIAECLKDPPDCLLLDIRMPGMDGLTVMQRLRGPTGGLPCPVIVLTGFGDEAISLEAIRLGAQDFLVKDQTSPQMLVRAVTYARERFAISRELARQSSQLDALNQTLRENDQRLRALFDQAGAGIAQVDAHGAFVQVNDAFCTMAGRSRDELLRCGLEDVLQQHSGFKELSAGGTREIRYSRPDRSVLWVSQTISAIRGEDSMPRCFLVVAQDITGRKRAEEALRSSEARMRAFLESASQGVVAVDESGHIVLVNAKTEEMFGYTRDDLLGRPLTEMLPERERALHDGHLSQYFTQPRTRAMGLGLDLHGRRKNGSEFPLEVTLSCIEQGGSRLAMALMTDITERKKADERLWQAQKLESIGVLAGGVAHDFNNLLVGVIGSASLARETLPPGHEAVELLERILSTGEQLANLTRQMLAYSGKGRYVVEPLSLSDLIPEMSRLLQPSITPKIALHFELAPDLPPVEADRGQVQQVFLHLVLNAAEAIGADTGLISVTTRLYVVEKDQVRNIPETAELPPGNYVCLEVRDTGCGMDQAIKSKIFDPFFTTKFTGRGLGLAAVAGIMRGHKGTIAVTSEPGKGSCFMALFPAEDGVPAVPPLVSPPATPAATRAATPAATLDGTGTILVVDDEDVVRGMVKRVLERCGYTVLAANSGPAAIDIFKRRPEDISLVVLDLGMPGMGGEQTLPELRKIRPDVRIVISSGYDAAETRTLFSGHNVSGFLEKPFTLTRLAEIVKKALA